MYAAAVVTFALLRPAHPLRQFGAFDALRTAHYDGSYPVSSLPLVGDFGLGTFNGLDGEMVVVDGKVRQIDGLGDTHEPGPGVKTPFAFVTRFVADDDFFVSSEMTRTELQNAIDRRLKGYDGIVAIRIDGEFKSVGARSFSTQIKPYKPFAEIVDRQSLLPYPSVSGTFVGFRMPKTVAEGHLNVPGYHFHFVTQDRLHGGHILRYQIEKAHVQLMRVSGITPLR